MSLADFLVAHAPFTLPRHLYSYVEGQTPLSTTPVVFGSLAFYLALIFGVQAVMKNREPQRLNTLFQAHNVFLSAGSLVLLVLLLEEILPIIWHNGLFSAMCDNESWTPRMEFYYMINYYFKYVELLRHSLPCFQEKAPAYVFSYLPGDLLTLSLAFLHVFHHSATALLCYSQLIGKTSISWTVISLNLTVHVLMYYYYYATAGGAKIWWKKYLTMMQIIQFVIDLFVVYFGTYGHFAATYYDGIIPHMGNCAGSETAALFGCGLLTSYLGLFINFYLQTYKKKPSKAPRANGTNGVANGHANGKTVKNE
ncbi:ELO family [Mycena metata]|uniref:Elongation of fatty acids protein n=1 Tax=Mycena metata TaxID=1033252 RepID=A0AAD7KJC9_9AGAR|nr:ELO family [Mycena metata]